MENLAIDKFFNNIYRGKRVLVTGHTGFKGSWLSLWLEKMGAQVLGFSLNPNTTPNHFQLLTHNKKSVIANINDFDSLKSTLDLFKPEIIFHLAAQPIVRESYVDPLTTFSTNIIGTANLLEASRSSTFIKAIVIITSDKCYENNETDLGYRETDPMGGYDPYSASKGCAEIIVSSYRKSFFNLNDYLKKHNTLIATARAGNVIGGGDWSNDRLIPDIIKATNIKKNVILRNPNAIRPWQHVLDPLSGYLLLGQYLLEGKKEYAEAFNFGPSEEGTSSVLDILVHAKKIWNNINFEIDKNNEHPHEANFLKLDCTKSFNKLKWKSNWELTKTIEKTIYWYREFYNNKRVISNIQIDEYLKDAVINNVCWTN